MQKVLLAVAAAVLAANPIAASEQTDVMALVHQFVDSFNKGDVKGTVAVCADQASVVDEFPPYHWSGAGACANWMNDYDADAKKNGITDGNVTLGKPKHVDVSGDRAYVVIPSDYAFTKNGKPVKETGSMFTIALRKEAAGWRVAGWAWAKN